MSTKRPRLRPVAGLTAAIAAVAAALIIAPAAFASAAGYTSVDTTIDGTGHCQNGNPNVNCNIYDAKSSVWLNGGPSAFTGDGSYFFAVLDPGSQADPNDGSQGNLSSPHDAYGDRTFSVSNGVVSYSGPHDFDETSQPPDLGKIRLMPYDDTPNPGGVYILAICSLANNYPVAPSSCKYDAFKVKASQTAPGASAPTIIKDAAGVDTNTFTWGITKSVDQTTITDSSGSAAFNYTVSVTHDAGKIGGVKVTGTITVFNPNTDDITGANVTDSLSDGTICAVTGGLDVTLAPGSNDFAYECDLSALPQSELDNAASVAWGDQTLSEGFLAGASAPFTFTNISFTETKADDCVDVTDTLDGDFGQVCSTDKSPKDFTYQYTVTGKPGTCVNQDNTATFTTNTTGTTGSDGKTVTLCTPADLTASKTATPTFTREFNWSILKSVDACQVVSGVGGCNINGATKTLNYTVKVTKDAGTDSGWKVSGTITVTNPNDFEAIVATVTDAVDNGGTCIVTGGTNVTVAAGKPVDLAYSCSWSSAPTSSSGTNTATVTWDSGAANTPDGSTTGTKTFSFTTPTTVIHGSVTLADLHTTTPSSLLGGFSAALSSGALPSGTISGSGTFNYAYLVTVPHGCLQLNNTASFTVTVKDSDADDTGSSSVVAKVCRVPAQTGALTMGFWQNKNGQAIITGGSSTGGVCNSGTWLRLYAPFQDLSATATCAQVGTYVTGIIKAATCTSSTKTCNSMLKSQMLATALDVYFSDPALGGNKIGAPHPIGGVNIDLTQICQMIDGSGGAASCSGSYENVSSAFGGATSLTVSAMLAYAASQSNAGGSAWYGQVKATQVLAKDAFDAINNQVAFSI